MLKSEMQSLIRELDQYLEDGDVLRLQDISQQMRQRCTSVLESTELKDLQDLTLRLVEHVQDRWSAIPAGYSEVFDCIFDAVNEIIQGDAGVYRTFADAISSQTDLNLPWRQIQLPRRGVAVLYNFVPFADTGASVASKRIRQLGGAVDVLSCSSIGKKL